jgi:tRNA modification GTPase
LGTHRSKSRPVDPGRIDTIAAIATSPGRGGIGIIRISGPDSYSIARKITHKEPESRTAHYAEFHSLEGDKLDSGILIYYPSPHSYTGEDVVELQGHGGPVVLGMLLRSVLAAGARQAEPGEFTERAFLNNKIDLLQAEAVADLINSVSEQAARSAARSLQGDFSKRIARLQEGMTSIRVFIESALDFPDEEIDFIADTDVIGRLNTILETTSSLLKDAKTGSKLREGLRAVIIGRPNVGKSSLLNRLTGEDRAIVTEIAGTTRDVIEDTITVGGIILNIVDTAGLREAEGVVEEEGIRRSVQEISKADIVIWVTDLPVVDDKEKTILNDNKIDSDKLLIVHNKMDLYQQASLKEQTDEYIHIHLSAKTGAGIEILFDNLLSLSGLKNTGEDLVLARERHIKAIETTMDIITASKQDFALIPQAELLAESLRRAQMELSRVTGELTADDLLSEVFSKFCIGK